MQPVHPPKHVFPVVIGACPGWVCDMVCKDVLPLPNTLCKRNSVMIPRAKGRALREHTHAPHTPGCRLSGRFELGRDPRTSPACNAFTQLPGSLYRTRGKKSWTSVPRSGHQSAGFLFKDRRPISHLNTSAACAFGDAGPCSPAQVGCFKDHRRSERSARKASLVA